MRNAGSYPSAYHFILLTVEIPVVKYLLIYKTINMQRWPIKIFYIFNLDCGDFYGFCSSQNFLLITCSVKLILAFISGINLWMISCHFVLTFSRQKKLEDTVECQLSYPSFEVSFFSYVKYKTSRYLVLKSKPIVFHPNLLLLFSTFYRWFQKPSQILNTKRNSF